MTDLLSTKRQELLTLSTKKQSLETEVSAIISELTSPIILPSSTDNPNSTTTTTAPPIGIDTPLVDSEGYPRSDIDLYRARSLRKRFHEIKTDYKVLEGKIERGLIELSALRAAASKEEQLQSRSNNNNSRSSSSSSRSENDGNKQQNIDRESHELKARQAHKPKPKFDPVTGKWVVKSWDGSVAGVKDGEVRKFDDLSHSTDGALASIAVVGRGGANSDNNGGSVHHHYQQQQQQQQHETSLSNSTSTTQTSTIQSTPSQTNTIALSPFAIIDQVFHNSPSQQAGIKEGDLLLRFGTVTSSNNTHNNNNNGGGGGSSFDSIKRGIVTELSIAAANEACISVAVRRTTSELGGIAEMIRMETFDLWPRSDWGGRGLLGCHLQEYNE